ncbi:MAG: transporter substrate-binding domain-containing protein [Clostridia bacterium]|nr:transporter substrate-binding domain-containing protein [Clostridia bacterium]
MKKIISLLLVVAMLATLACSCGKAKEAKVIAIDLTTEEYAFGVDKNNAELLQKTNEFIAKIMDDGTFDDICNRYFDDKDGNEKAVTSAKQGDRSKQLWVATNAEFAPFEYKKGNSYYGIDMEIAAALAKFLGKELVILDMDFDSVCLSVGQSKADIAMAGLTVQEDRKEHVTFSKTYYKASQHIVTTAKDDTFDGCKTAKDVLKKLQKMDKDTKIGYQNGTTGQQYVKSEGDYADNKLKVTGKGYSNGVLAVQDLMNGNIDYVVIDAAPAKAIVKSLNGK